MMMMMMMIIIIIIIVMITRSMIGSVTIAPTLKQ